MILMWLSLLPLSLALSGPIRAVCGCGINVALVLALLISAALGIAIKKTLRGTLHVSRLDALVAAVVGIIAAAALTNRALGPLVSYVGSDGGMHLDSEKIFLTSSPQTYGSCVALFALFHFIEVFFRVNAFWAVAITFYLQTFIVAAWPTLLALIVLRKDPQARSIAGPIAFVTALASQYFIVLPLEHYYQADGFFPQAFALVMLLGIWMADTLIESILARALALGFAVTFYRYTYALNMGDALIALAFMWFVDSFATELPKILRFTLRALPLILIYGAYRVYQALLPLTERYGWFLEYELKRALLAEAGGAVVLAIALLWAKRSERFTLARAFRFPFLFVLTNAVCIALALRFPLKEPYYLLKYDLHAIVLLASAFVVLIPALSAPSGDGAGRVIVRVVLGMLVLVCGKNIYSAFGSFQPTFQERVWGQPPFERLKPLVDLGAWRRIDQVLHQNHAQFGGYLVAYGPMYNFMNAGFGFLNGSFHHPDGPPNEQPGHCVFWDEDRGTFGDWEKSWPMQRYREPLFRDDQKSCSTYRAHWNPSSTRKLCHRCY